MVLGLVRVRYGARVRVRVRVRYGVRVGLRVWYYLYLVIGKLLALFRVSHYAAIFMYMIM